MGFYIRKSLRMGPIRFNLSKGGMGVSAGITGLRLGMGPRGTYVHAGRGGLYYRKYLFDRSGRKPEPGALPNGESVPAPAPVEPDPDSIRSVPATEIRDSDAESLLAEIRDKKKTPPLFGIVLVFWIIATCVAFAHSTNLALTMLVIGLVGAYPLYVVDQRARSVVVMYDLEPAAENAFRALYDAIMEIGSCANAWSVTTKRATSDYKHNAGAAELVDRKPLAVGADGAPFLKTNVAVPSFRLAADAFYFFPDHVFVANAGGVGAVPYDRFQVSASARRFIEDGAVPRDAKIVGSTWQYVNKSGGPDRRFSNNRQLPIAMYQDVTFSSETGVRGYIQLSRIDAADRFVAALEQMRIATGRASASQAPSAAPTSQPMDASGRTGDGATVGAIMLDMSLTGPKLEVVARLRDLAARFQKEVDARSSRAMQSPAAKPIDAVAFTKLAGQAINSLAAAVAELAPAMEQAASPSGSTELLVLRYATFLEEILDAERMVAAASVPPTVSRSQGAVLAFVESMYAQAAKWPGQLAASADSVAGDSQQVRLRLDVDTAAVQKAMADDLAAARR